MQDFEVKPPACPGCKISPLSFSHQLVTTHEGATISLIHCILCGHTLEARFVGFQKPQILMPGMA